MVIYVGDGIVAVEGEQATLSNSRAVQSDLVRSGLVGNVKKSRLELARSLKYVATWLSF